MKKLLMLMILFVTLLSACSNDGLETITFHGDSENWSSELVIKQVSGDIYEEVYVTLEYLGDEEVSLVQTRLETPWLDFLDALTSGDRLPENNVIGYPPYQNHRFIHAYEDGYDFEMDIVWTVNNQSRKEVLVFTTDDARTSEVAP
ncbi:hypothetical protein BKP35_05065 [Anaerobacillus arseniciselenatis]|uniref:Uncharacterized protein n=1 Tax=Anaerobacillus arseniciselenatis TaxID=85682 RepID=A0A1S2LSN1_9BACI|nr:hypothetical protein [Anaerobacillus arseniciselenatis]OIJ15220.1 hypothetical protein BKP35_05065 [Anaerobacillus arseniciselenatis]